jgi:hypothetical protein
VGFAPRLVMTTQNPEDTSPPVTQPAPAPGTDARRRLRELLSVPERDRSDEQWDEIIELEIQLAPGNRVSAGDQGNVPGGGGQPKLTGQPGQPKKHRPRGNTPNRRPRPNKPTGNPV